MRAIVLAAGEGTRLRPYTQDRPKAMVPLAGVPLITHQLATLARCGVEDVSLVTGYRASELEKLGRPTRYNAAYDRTNMVTSLMCAADLLDGSDDVIVAYADIVYEDRVLERLMACPAPVCTTVDRDWKRLWELRMEDPLKDAETLRLDDHGDIIELGKRPESLEEIEGQYMGLIKISAATAPEWVRVHRALDPRADYDGKNLPNLYMTSFLQHLIDHGHPVRAVPIEGGWLEIDTVQDLDRYNEMARSGTLSGFCRLAAPARAEA